MRPRLAILLALLAVLMLVAVQAWRRPAPDPSATQAASATRAEPDRRLAFPPAASRAELEALLEGAYRLAPDRRMTAALAHVSALLDPRGPDASVRADWSGAHWELAVASDSAGRLPALPGFADGLAAAERRARAMLARSPLPQGRPDGIAAAFLADALPEQALAALDEAARRSGATAALVEQAAAACVQLSLLLREDRSSYADTTMARALALLAVARASGRGPLRREACALASAMGYGEEARALALPLVATDPVRAFVLRQDARLSGLASAPGASRECRVLTLLARARADDLAGWQGALESAGELTERELLSTLATALAFRRFDAARAVGPALIRASLVQVPSAPDRPGPDPATIIAFERAIARPEVALRGPLAGGAVAAARRALFYSGVLSFHTFVRDRLASPRVELASSEQLASLDHPGAAWLARWQRTLALGSAGEDVAVDLRRDLEDPAIPPPCALESYEALVERMPRGMVSARSAARALAARLDSRPRWASKLAIVAQEQALWPTLAERLLSHAARRGGHDAGGATLLLALMRNDQAALAAIVGDPQTDAGTASRALRIWVAADSGAAEALLPRFADVARRDPRDWSLADAHADVLEARGRFAEAARVVRSWMASADATRDALDSTLAVTSLARLLRKQGRVGAALDVIGDLELGQQRGAMEEKARLLACAGRLAPAQALAEEVRERYPHRDAATALPIELDWRAGRYAEAAARVAPLPTTSPGLMGEIAQRFGSVFGGRPAEAKAALAAIRAVAPAYTRLLWWIAREFRLAGDVAFAAELAAEAHPGSGADRGVGVAGMFELLAAARGEAEARRWLERQTMDFPARVLASGFLAMRGHVASAWELLDGPPDDEYVWLMRAAYWSLDGGRRADRADSVRAHVRGPGDGGLYRTLARYMLREVGEADVLALADDARHRTEVWYFCALRAWAEGRSRDAVFWMVLCQEVESTRDGEYIWSRSILSDWCATWRTPERLGLGPRPRA